MAEFELNSASPQTDAEKPLLKLPDNCRDVTLEKLGTAFAIIGYPTAADKRSPAIKAKGPVRDRK